ncbi:sarcoplasmic calcium-binding protein [Daktulosphaira vitifoliae]|uniref:sarcoplasmic calcium-binding protein n=1 Tax=Daktulosphaira vitifoliae TaxID=58002 RepID=UPI0021AAD770|nr:sarcoplasmic calcium-binding protein [Daktulosphaira vitifoliae]XP_050526983.1 sarcoplasmic calcium-binding protein [Daktulosphaira vitifoliae]
MNRNILKRMIVLNKNCQKYIHLDRGNRFIVSRKLFENEHRLKHNKNLEPNSKWASKLRAYHELMDVNKDGVVSSEDLLELTERFSTINNMTREQSLMFSKVIKNLWYKHWGCIDPFSYVTVEKYLNYIQYVKQNKELKHDVIQLLPYLFKTVDKDQSGDISKDEYDQFLKCIGTSAENQLIESLGIVNDTDGTIKLDDLIIIIEKNFFKSDNVEEF